MVGFLEASMMMKSMFEKSPKHMAALKAHLAIDPLIRYLAAKENKSKPGELDWIGCGNSNVHYDLDRLSVNPLCLTRCPSSQPYFVTKEPKLYWDCKGLEEVFEYMRDFYETLQVDVTGLADMVKRCDLKKISLPLPPTFAFGVKYGSASGLAYLLVTENIKCIQGIRMPNGEDANTDVATIDGTDRRIQVDIPHAGLAYPVFNDTKLYIDFTIGPIS